MGEVSEVVGSKGGTVIGVHPSETVYTAIERMVEHNCGSLLVIEDDSIVGIFTERDYLRKIALKGRTSKTTAVAEVMTTPVIVVEADAKIDEALAMMTDRHIRHLPVIDGKKIVGVVSIGDLVKYKTKEQEFHIGYLEDYIGAR